VTWGRFIAIVCVVVLTAIAATAASVGGDVDAGGQSPTRMPQQTLAQGVAAMVGGHVITRDDLANTTAIAAGLHLACPDITARRAPCGGSRWRG
jgi:hypothetical protein